MKTFSWVDFNMSNTQAWVRNSTPPSDNKPLLSQCWSRTMSPYEVIRTQWVEFNDDEYKCITIIFNGKLIAVTTIKSSPLNYWGTEMHICTIELGQCSSTNGLVSIWHQAIIWIDDNLSSVGPWGTYPKLCDFNNDVKDYSHKTQTIIIFKIWQTFCLRANA